MTGERSPAVAILLKTIVLVVGAHACNEGASTPVLSATEEDYARFPIPRSLRVLCVSALLLGGAARLEAQPPAWMVDSAVVTFEVRNAGLPVRGTFERIDASVCFDRLRPETSSLSGTLDPGAIRTGIAMRDRHLQRHGWFEVAKYGTIEMHSERLRRTSDGYTGTFMLRIRDVSRQVEVPFTFEADGRRARLGGALTIDRLDFGLGKPSVILSDDVTIRIELRLRGVEVDGGRRNGAASCG